MEGIMRNDIMKKTAAKKSKPKKKLTILDALVAMNGHLDTIGTQLAILVAKVDMGHFVPGYEVAGNEEAAELEAYSTFECDGKRILKVTFPKLSLRDIFEQSGGKAENAYPLVYDFEDSWVRSEPFFSEEFTCGRTCEIDLEVSDLGKDWNECDTIVRAKGKRMLNMAEMTYLYWKHGDVVGPVVSDRWTWLSTRTVDADLGGSGFWDSSGSRLSRRSARYSRSNLGLGFSCTEV